jgi:outer membrane lipoprotein-sorting protein
MAEAAAVAFESELRIGVGGAGGIEVTQKVKALLKRPNLARLELSGAGQDALIVLDGTKAWHLLKLTRRYVESKQLGTMKLEQYGAGPAATLFFEKGGGSLLPYLSDAVVTQEKIDAETCDVVAWKVGAEESSLWIGANRLRRFRTTRSLGEQKFVQTIDYGEFDLAPQIAADACSFTPPKGAHPIGAGDESDLLDIGAAAPEFTATGLDGKSLKLAGFKGRPLLVTFWFYG